MRPRIPVVLSCLSLAVTACTSFTRTEDGDAPDGGRANANSGGRSPGSGGKSENGSGGRASGGTKNEDGGTKNGDGGGPPGSGGEENPESTGGEASTSSAAKRVAERLGRNHFLIGMGNDTGDGAIGAFTLSATLDLHYVYLVGLRGQSGWPDWNTDESGDGAYLTYLALEATSRGVVPMFTLYAMAAAGEGQLASLTNDSYMRAYWEGARLMFERLGALGVPSVVHLEPDFWGFAQHNGEPEDLDVIVQKYAPECEDMPENLAGMGRCMIHLARTYAPQTLVGFHASSWGSPDPAEVARYLVKLGASESDLVFTDMLDRDAGCFEAQAEECQRQDGPWYLDETNQKSPNFHEMQDFARAITTGTKVPLMWWQIPFGVPSETPGGTPGQYRDNKVKYLFEHIEEFVAVGGVGAVFGVGAGNQTYITTDGGQFDRAVSSYYENPYLL